ncbi:MAG: tetratricopeptide repeat protein [Oleiphilaceae bacterium]|nr:tetratricopeptide repeat protein [Oleiphilaceae bacterium]
MSLEDYAKKRFLIVDELENFRFSTKNTLMSLGCKLVDTASNAQGVVSGFQNVNYDVILCNYELGKGKNGQELLEELRLKRLLKFTGLFFIISAEVERGKVMGTIENEPDGYLVKPVKPSDLRDRLVKALKMKDAMFDIDNAIDEGDYHSAIAYCDKKIADKDRYAVRCFKTKAWLLQKIGDWAQARSVYESVLKSNDYTWAQYGLARIYIKQKRYDEAEQLLNDIIAKDPDQVEAMDLLTEILRKKGDAEGAQQMVEQAINLSPNSLHRQLAYAELCQTNNKPEQAVEAFRKVVKLGEQSVYAKPQHYFEFSDFLAKEGAKTDDPAFSAKSIEAFELLNKCTKRFSNIDEIKEQSQLVAANVHAILGDEEKARTILNEILGSDDNDLPELDPETFRVAAQALETLGEADRAEKLLEHAADLATTNTDLMSDIYDQLNQSIGTEARQQAAKINKLGIKLYNDGKIEEAAKELKRAIPLTPRHISLNLNLVQVLLKLHRRNGDESLLKEIHSYLHKVRHIPSHHKEYPRYEYLKNQLAEREQAA